MSTRARWVLLASFLASIATSAEAFQDSQPVSRVSRRVGIAVRETEVGLAPNTRPVVSVFGPPGTFYILFMEPVFGGSVVDAVWGPLLGTLTPCIGVFTSPNIVTMNSSMTAPPGQTVGIIPASGRQDLSMNTTIPAAFANNLVIWQAFASDPLSLAGQTLTNGQVRRLVQPITRPDLSNYATNNAGVAPVNDYIDIEQGDVDDDGDPDTLLVQPNGSHQLLISTLPVLGGPPVLTANPASLFGINPRPEDAAEFADFNNDGHIDLVMVGPPSSLSQRQVAVYRNLGPNVTPGIPGTWQGFANDSANVKYDLTTFPFPGVAFTPNDVETGDIDGDGDLDIVIACGLSPTAGEQNRLFINRTQMPGGAITFEEVTATAFHPLLNDDSEDVEFADFDNDGDLDIVFGNFDGPTGRIGEETIWQNTTIPGALPTFSLVANNFANLQDETMDVCVADFDLDGRVDIYVANWLGSTSNFGGPPWLGPVRDRLLLNTTTGGVITFTDSSQLLPDSPVYVGPGTPLPAQASIDAEAVDYDLDGDLDIVVPVGTKGVSSAGALFGIRMLRNTRINPVPTSGEFQLDPGAFTGNAAAIDYWDVELGDWQANWFDRDIGAATSFAPPSGGFMMLQKN